MQSVNYVSFHTSLMQLAWDINFPAFLFKSFDRLHFQLRPSDVDVEEKFFLHICGKKRLDWKLRSKREINKLLEWFHSTLRWKGKYQQNWKESSELKIAPKTKNQYSCRRGCQNDNLACGKVNLRPNHQNCRKSCLNQILRPKPKIIFSAGKVA